MRILFLTQVLPYPLDAGPKVRAYYVLKHLASRHEITLVSFVRPTDSPDSLAHIQGLCSRLVTVPIQRSRLRDAASMGLSLVKQEPFLILRDRVAELRRTLTELLEAKRFDAIHADQLWMATYALQAAQAVAHAGWRPRLVLDQHNAVFLIPQRMADGARNPLVRYALKHEAHLMARYETRICQQFDHVVWVTKEDLQAVSGLQHGSRKLQTANQNTVIPICVDPSSIPIYSHDSEVLFRNPSPAILFIGGMHWPPNAEGVAWFLQHVFPLVRAQIPDIQFHIVGKSPPAELGSQAGVVAPGYVEDAEFYWQRSQVFIVPLRAAGGMRVKILDAWARGVPVISTTIGAEGISYKAGDHLLIADTPQDFSQAIIRVFYDDQLWQHLSRNGRKMVEENYDWRRTYKLFDPIYPAGSNLPH